MRRSIGLLAVVVAALTSAACAGSGSSEAPPPPSSTTTVAPGWAKIDRALAAMGPNVGLLAARVSPSGRCEPVHAIHASTGRPIASQFKLFVLGTLADRIASGRLSWQTPVPIDDAHKSAGNSPESGSLQFASPGTSVSVDTAATKMISISDNTAADLLARVVGRKRIEAHVRRWATAAHAAADVPFLTTREMLLLHYAPGLADRYLATPRSQRAAFVAASVDPLPLSAIAAGYSTEPRSISTIEWFASPADLCRAFAGLQHQSRHASLARLSTILSRQVGGIGLDPVQWPTVWFKGGSEAGVLTLGWLATNRAGKTFVVEAMVSDPDAALAPSSITDLVALGRDAFGMLR